MYESFYGFREKPFAMAPDPQFLYLGGNHRSALSTLEYGLLNRAGFVVITGDIGSGKTTLIRYLLTRLPVDVQVGLIANTHRSFGTLLQWIVLAFGLEYRGKGNTELYQLFVDYLIAQYAANRRSLLIVDEAQNLDHDMLEELRVLSNINTGQDQLLQLVLVGQPELRGMLRQPGLEQFAQRVTAGFHLDALTPVQTHAYIQHRLAAAGGDKELFDPSACQCIAYYSRGVPRLINTLCDTALVYGFAEQLVRVELDIVKDVVRDGMRVGIVPLRPDSNDEPNAILNVVNS